MKAYVRARFPPPAADDSGNSDGRYLEIFTDKVLAPQPW
jgi:hypothetical protein